MQMSFALMFCVTIISHQFIIFLYCNLLACDTLLRLVDLDHKNKPIYFVFYLQPKVYHAI